MSANAWYRTALRWGQTNLVEIDPARYDAAWWQEHWRRTRVQGVIVNAGGIVAYYPTMIPLHRRAAALGDGDLYGDIVRAAREQGLHVIARMDSNRVAEDFYRSHPGWTCVDSEGKPYTQADKYVTCINSPYYDEYLPRVMEEIIRQSAPDGFSDNSWAGLRREQICHCGNCAERFFARTRMALPKRQDWADERYRLWVRWNYERRTELWESNNAVTMAAGGPECRWMGMVSGDILNNANRFIDIRAIMARSPIVMLDHQRRNGVDGFEQNTEAGKRLHELAGWNTLIPESTPQYQLGAPAFRLASMPAAEVKLWSSSAFAGGIQPWWHHIGALHEDRRQYRTAEPIFTWHEDNQDILVDREPVADVGLVWSQENHDYHGRNAADERTMNPYRGAMRALDRAALTYVPLHADDVEKSAARFRVLLLPDLAAMSDAQIAAVRAFAERGGAVVATGESGLYTEHGDARPDAGLADLFGLERGVGSRGGIGPIDASHDFSARHSYLRLSPELRAGVHGPRDATAAATTETRHPVLTGLDDTDTLPFGGFLPVMRASEGTAVLATYVPDFPIFPPETSWMRVPRTDLPAITARTTPAGARLVWFVADVDRCYARDAAFEHALLLTNAVRWALDDRPIVTVEGGHGFIAPTLYRQDGRLILHLNNRVVTTSISGRQNELLPIGPLRVGLRIASDTRASEVALRVAGERVVAECRDGLLTFSVRQVSDHEVAVVELARD